MRKIVQRKEKGESIELRIDQFIEKLTENIDEPKLTSPAVRNEMRFLGAQGDTQKFAIGTIRVYLSFYRDAVAQRLPYASTAREAIEKLNRRYDGALHSVLVNWRTPYETMRQIGQIIADMDNKTTGLYDALKRTRIAHPAYYMLKIKPGQAATLKDKYRETINSKKRNNTLVSINAIEHAVKTGLASGAKYATLVALSLCCGRRPIELYKTGSFAADKAKGCVRFSGQAKLKNGTTGDAYSIPVLFITPKQFLAAFNAFRELINRDGSEHDSSLPSIAEMSYKQINARISRVSETARRMLFNHDVELYTCRSIYAEIVAMRNPELDRDALMSDILGHSRADTVTAQSYQGVTITSESLDAVAAEYERQKAERPEIVLATGRTKKEDKGPSAACIKRAEARADRLKKMQPEADAAGKAVSGINAWAIDFIQSNPDVVLTQTLISKVRPSSRPAIKKWLQMTRDIFSK